MTRTVPGFYPHARLVAFCCLSLGTFASSALAADEGVKVEGEVKTGVEVLEFKNGKAVTEAQLKIETKRVDSVKAKIELEMDNLDRVVEMEEVFLDKKFSDEQKLVIGLTKKIIGLEYERSDNERMPLSRTLVYRKLETFAFVGRETTVRYISEDENKKAKFFKASLGYADSLDYNISSIFSLPVGGDLSVLWSGLVQSDKINKGRQLAWATAFSALYDSETMLLEAELFAGIDPYESEFEKAFGSGRTVHFGAAKFLAGMRLGGESQYEPFLGYSNVRHDVEYVRYYSAEYLAGLNYYINKAFTLAANMSLVATNSRFDYSKFTWNDSSVEFSAGMRF
jgi:hypothetical protein